MGCRCACGGLILVFSVIVGPGCSSLRLAGPAQGDAACRLTGDYARWQKVLETYVVDGTVNYEQLKAEPGELEVFVGQIGRFGPGSTPEGFKDHRGRLAYWINAHNAAAMLAAVRKYPAKTVRPIFGDFDRQVSCWTDGQWLTLRQIASRALTASNGDPRVRLAMASPAKGSGKLLGKPFVPEKIQTQLTELYRQALDDSTMMKVDHDKWTLWLGKPIYDARRQYIERYRKMLGTDSGSIINALALDAKPNQRRKLNTALGYKVRPIPYDWSLNEWLRPRSYLD